MKKLILLTLSGLALHTASVAQSDFRPGYIVQPSGDTLRGEVDYRSEQRNTRLCSFRATAATPATDYQPEQLRGYGFAAGKHYQTRQLRWMGRVGCRCWRATPSATPSAKA